MKHQSKTKTTKSGNQWPMEGCMIGLDVSDEYTHAAVLDGNGELVEKRGYGRGKWMCAGG